MRFSRYLFSTAGIGVAGYGAYLIGAALGWADDLTGGLILLVTGSLFAILWMADGIADRLKWK